MNNDKANLKSSPVKNATFDKIPNLRISTKSLFKPAEKL